MFQEFMLGECKHIRLRFPAKKPIVASEKAKKSRFDWTKSDYFFASKTAQYEKIDNNRGEAGAIPFFEVLLKNESFFFFG